MPCMTGARFIAETFKGYGVTHAFYMEIILPRALAEMERLGIRRIVTHSEKGAAYMADGYARLGQKVGLCMAQSVGAANLAAGLQDACLAHAPVLAVTGSKPPLFQQRNAYQEIQHRPLYEPLTKYNIHVGTTEQLPVVLPQAFRAATTGKPGPVHVDLLGLFGEGIEREEREMEVVVETAYASYPVHRPLPEAGALHDAARALARAERPVLIAGRGAMISGAAAEVLALAERLSIPVAASPDAKTVMLDTHPLYLGTLGGYGRPCANNVVAHSDLAFFVGTGTGDQLTANWTLPPQGTATIQLDIDPTEVGRNYPGGIGLVGDAREGLRALLALAEPVAGRDEWTGRARETVEHWRRLVAPLRDSDALPMRPERLCKEVTLALPEDGVLVADTGYSAIWTSTLVDVLHPEQVYLRSAGSLGWSVPAAIGAKCAEPGRPVVCFCGDGAFWYHMAELETASRWGIQVVVVVNNNSVLGQIVPFNERAWQGLDDHHTDAYRYRQTNFARLAEEMGCYGLRVENPGDVRAAIKMALAQERPAVIDAVTDPDAHPIFAM
jgi:acetolactate synthase I/II/III large subunit